ncbi:SusC/RagA family TonB-linked outer membrane protein [Membranihabitans maritimus]|uniref:SusC/RagA family TonB-linked outer membrane protein n=1 Tax=Membranihabitans maritimus TaxID=2904244 RepID=UPI001F48AADA|nr:TonB-dependent receptor [Membranihabitans maritimus]
MDNRYKMSLILFLWVLVSNFSPAQGGELRNDQGILDYKIQIDLSNASLEEVLDKIGLVSHVEFLYSPQRINSQQKLDVYADNEVLSQFLNRVLGSLDITYEVIEGTNQIMLFKTEKVDQLASAVSFQDRLRANRLNFDRTVNGTVTDSEGNPLIGANIAVKSRAGLGTVTDFDGKYSLEIPNGPITLVFSYIGYETMEVDVIDQEVVNAVLSENASQLDEVVVVGYGTQKKSDLTGAVSSINSEDLTNFPATGTVHALQGKAAGVMVQSTNGEPGGDFKIRVRGSTSINASSNPLFVVDGFVGGTMPPPEDIASIEVLKDASATAIYGSRGANGVIMVTTKSGANGVTKFNYNTYYSFHKEIGRLDLLGARDFAEYINDARDAEFYDLSSINVNTDWQSLIFRPGHAQNHQLSVSGGGTKVKYYVSGVYFDQKGVIQNSRYDRFSLISNLDLQASDKINLKLNTSIRSSNRDGIPTQTGGIAANSGVVSAAQRFDPNQGIIDEDGIYTKSRVGIAAFENPMAILDGREEGNVQNNIQSNLHATIDLFNNFVFNSTYGLKIENVRNGTYNSRITNQGENTNGQGSLQFIKRVNFLTEQYFNYSPDLGEKNNLILTAGYSYQRFNNESLNASNTGFISDALGFWNLGSGTTLISPSSSYGKSEIASFYGRVNYSFEQRYLLTFTSRYDGASQFSKENQWSFFPSGAFSWNISNERFFPTNNLITNLKLRTSYGLTGNQGISAYQSLARLSTTYFILNNSPVSSVRPTSIANKDLTWETTGQYNLGLDLELFSGRLNLTGEYYYKKTRDLLFNVPIPSFSGFQNRLENIGKVENKGFEFQLDYRVLTGDFNWNTAFNITFNRNKVLELPGGVDIIFSSAPSQPSAVPNSILREGEPVGSFFGYVYEGVYQEGDEFIPGGSFETSPGGEKFADLNGDGILNSDDRKIIGDPNPDAIWGFNNDFTYKGISLNLFFQAYTGADMLNIVRMELDRLSGNSNATVRALDRWTPSNTETNVPKATSDRAARTSTRFVEDGSYIRLKNLSLGYNLPTQLIERAKLNSTRIYFSAQNILTFSDYSGVDPEVAFRSSNTNIGLDFGSYPNTQSFTLGLTIGF